SRTRLRDLVRRVKDDTLSDRQVRYDQLPELLIRHFHTGDALRQFASDHLDLSLDELVGRRAGGAEMVETLVNECHARGRMQDLACALVIERPDLSDRLAVDGG